MKTILLGIGKEVLVDDGDFEHLGKWNWWFDGSYAVRADYLGKIDGKYKYKKIYMHKEINKTPSGLITDHINRNTLDNRRCNLRTGDKKLNSINRGLQVNNTSGYRGVCWNKSRKLWESKIKSNQKTIHLGFFKEILEAVGARKEAEGRYFIC